MLRIFVVDDEDMIREGIRNALEVNTSRFHLMGEAPDGEMALPQLQELKPDVLITDIRMPFMDGLELCQQVRRTMPWMRIIILSGHDEFSYAQRAISLGVNDYLLKPITGQQLIDTLNKVSIDIEREKNDLLKFQNDSPDPDKKQILIEHFLNQLLSGGLSVSEAQTRAAELQISLTGFREFIVAYTDLSHFTRLEQRQILKIAHENLDKYPDLLIFSREGHRLVFLAGTAETGQVINHMYGAMQAFLHEMSFYLELQSPIGIGMSVQRLSELPSAWQSAKIAYANHTNLRSGTIYSLGHEHGKTNSQNKDWDSLAQSGIDFSTEHGLTDVLGYIETTNRDQFVDNYFRTGNDQEVQSILYRYYLTMNLTMTIGKLLAKIGHDLKTHIEYADQADQIFKRSESLESSKELARELIDLYVILRRQGQYRYNKEISEARTYIQEHFSNVELSLQDVAQHVGYSPNHFSTVFSQETGETFIGYLTRIRLENACHQLSKTELKLREIAESSGYSEAHYFSYLFKKHYGMPPSEYRAQINYDNKS